MTVKQFLQEQMVHELLVMSQRDLRPHNDTLASSGASWIRMMLERKWQRPLL
jgi:hypothetical protein